MSELPHVTVATVVNRDGRYLMVQEKSGDRIVYNQPAGHVEPGETLLDAAIRETLEETAWKVQPHALLGIYQYTSPDNGISYVRHCFLAEAIEEDLSSSLDDDIEAALWMSLTEIEKRQTSLRSPLVLQAIHDHLDGISYPLATIRDS